MATRPLLIFPQPERAPRMKRSGGQSNLHFPTHRQQARRLGPRFERLRQAFEAERAELRLDPGLEPERVLVMETIEGVEEFIRAVRRTPGMEWLGEWEEEATEPDEYFYMEPEPERPLRGRLYLVMSNQRALEELVNLWNRYRRNPKQKFAHGLNKWRNIFRQLRDIRYWEARDRVDLNLVRLWEEQLERNRDHLVFKAELWFSSSEEKRRRNQDTLEQLVREEGGRVLGQVVIPEIAFHALAGELPAAAAGRLIHLEPTRLVQFNQVMFFRPLGQSAALMPEDEPSDPVRREGLGRPEQEAPIVGLLDGLPLENHGLLANRIMLDDPDGWGENYLAEDRVHGTMMASLIAHGELDANEPPISSPIYARPILRPDRNNWRGTPVETIPEDILPEDLVHRAVMRIFEGESGGDPVAPSVRIITFAIGDPSSVFDRTPSPLARLLDWLAWRYRVLFLVSAGNHRTDIELNVPRGSLHHLQPQELERATITGVESDAFNRRLLSPAEAINALTVAAVHSDASTVVDLQRRIDPYTTPDLPSPINALGLGYRRSVKPEVLFPGGRQLFTERLGNADNRERLQIHPVTTRPPGQRSAAPGRAGDRSATRYYCGTSNATALAARRAVQMYDVLTSLGQQRGGEVLNDGYTAVLLKTMLVHGCSWDGPIDVIEAVLQALPDRPPVREYAPRFLGYGLCTPARLFSCPQERATLIGCGELADGQAHVYRVPLPPSLSGQLVWRRLTITLSWLTPINPTDRYYRRASLWFQPPQDELIVRRCQVDHQMAQRGTVQHEILEGDQAVAFVDGQTLVIQVNCRAQTGKLVENIPYAIAVSLEVAEGTAIPIYDEVRARLRVVVPVEARNPNA